MASPLLVSGLSAAALAVSGGLLTDVGPWYQRLKKPGWKPPDWAFGPIWTVILICWAIAGKLAWQATRGSADRRDVLILFGVNALFFTLWNPLFFKLRRPDWSLVEVVFFWASVAAMIGGLWRLSPTASLLLLPYIVWVSAAAKLNRDVVRLNAPFGGR